MQNRKLPQVNALVIAIVDKIEKYGAYCKLVEYNNTEAFMPLKEVSAGWIKNIHEFLHKGRTIVCRVTDVNEDKGTIDISLKKVTPSDSKEKINEYNLEKRIKSLVYQSIKKVDLLNQKDKINEQILSEFGSYIGFHNEMIEKTTKFKNSKIPVNLKEEYSKIIENSRQKKNYIVSYTLKLINYNAISGITEIKEALKAAENQGTEIRYLGAPKYLITAKGIDYNDAEEKVKKAFESIKTKIKNGELELKKNRTKGEKSNILENI